MLSRGLSVFIQKKKIKSKIVINAFLKHKNITSFTYNNHRKVNNYIDKNWNEFATFVDHGIKTGKFKGDSTPCHGHWKREKENNKLKKEAWDNGTDAEKKLHNLIARHDNLTQMNKTYQFTQSKSIKLPEANYAEWTDGSRFGRFARNLPKYQYIISRDLVDELKAFLISSSKIIHVLKVYNNEDDFKNNVLKYSREYENKISLKEGKNAIIWNEKQKGNDVFTMIETKNNE